MAASKAQPQVDMLSQLRDIHAPDPVSWWPLAPGWWILLVLIVGVLSWLTYYLWNRKPEIKLSTLALNELNSIAAKTPSTQSLAEAIQLLRRLLMARVDKASFASISLLSVVEFIQNSKLATIKDSSIELFKNKQYAPDFSISVEQWQTLQEDLRKIITIVETESTKISSWVNQNNNPPLAQGFAHD
ncbi:MAG: DUF4381 domain-containing protein [Gammaproteobacteria bacterium]|nr:DUF4381 domain-containing protein [Gammaproteobacteria bacterium]